MLSYYIEKVGIAVYWEMLLPLYVPSCYNCPIAMRTLHGKLL